MGLMSKRLVSHFANMLYIGAVLTVLAVTRLALVKVNFTKASLKNISRLAFLLIVLRKPS
ncbi:hypothetical protein DABAL43B_2132 [Psychrobacter sp. DAB_AL43B]|nr:hypothetical protein DABAL43B_2132 [Psychrobacter sp. DAB_AL43B]